MLRLTKTLPKYRRAISSIPKTKQSIENFRKVEESSGVLIGLPDGPNEGLTASPKSFNTNPRNLEKIGLARRDFGWGSMRQEDLDQNSGPTDKLYKVFSTYPQRNVNYLMHVEFANHRVQASLEHAQSQNIVLSASTKEWQIRRRLFQPDDTTAAFNIGRIIADRALSCGFNRVHLVHPDLYQRPSPGNDKLKYTLVFRNRSYFCDANNFGTYNLWSNIVRRTRCRKWCQIRNYFEI